MIAAALVLTGCGDGCGPTMAPGDDDPGSLPIADMPRTGPDGPFIREEGGVRRLEGAFVGGKPSGEWVARHPNGQEQARGRFDDQGRPVGEWRSYWADGTLQEKGSYVAGEADGVWQMSWPDGSLFEELEMQAGSPHGTWRMFFEGGALADVMTFDRGLQVGLETDYARDGTKLAEGHFTAGKPTGVWRCFEGESSRTIPPPGGDVTPREACGHPALPELEID
ncbi:MAG: hypothetical protein KDA24_24115 [Deltaproteobacteria bacterium]|nr:hypothetical protein [Deltaproteobacteria bacterium]